MSAICGVLGRDGRPWTEHDLGGVMDELRPLGPDGRGIWTGSCGRGVAVVGAALRARTPEDAADRQPVRSADGSLVLVADLRLDNRPALAARLGMRDHPQLPDSALALAACERWGIGFLDQLIGVFALALVDRNRGGVLLARDHLGNQPLLIHERGQTLAFASTTLALTRLEGVGHRLDVIRAAEVLALAYSSERSFVEGVRWLPPGGALWADSAGTRQWRWWRPELIAPDRTLSGPECARQLRESFDEAVAAQLRSDGPIGAQTSGGLDSSSVTATAAGLLAPRPLRTYTSAPPPDWSGREVRGWDADESPLVRDLAARHPSIRPTFIHAPLSAHVLDLHEPLWRLGAGPTRNPDNAIWMHAVWTQAADDGVRTLLIGAAGNLFFSADGPAWLAALLRAGRILELGRELAAWSRYGRRSVPWLLRHRAIPPLVPPVVRRWRRRGDAGDDPVTAWLAGSALRPEVAAELDLKRLLPQLGDGDSRDERSFAVAGVQATGGQAETSSAVEGFFGLDRRDPTGDRRLIELALRHPEWVRRRRGVTRAVVRTAMAGRLPSSILNRTRRGEQLPDWLDHLTAARGELTAEIQAASEHGLSRELIDTSRLQTLIRRWPEPGQRADPQIVRDYRYCLLRAVHLSRYLRWFEDHAQATDPPDRRAPSHGPR